jgi:AhpD family alkylhydroperoxidase
MTGERTCTKTGPIRDRVYGEIRDTLGVVPSLFDHVPETALELEWQLFRRTVVEDTIIPPKYRELTGIALAGVLGNRYCAYAHTEFAKLYGATDAEIEEVVHLAKSIAGWNTYAGVWDLDYEKFKAEIATAVEHARLLQKAA